MKKISAKTRPMKVSLNRKKLGGEAPLVVNQITDGCLYTGFFGTLDSARMISITDKILSLIQQTGSDKIIIDMSNVDLLDSSVATHLQNLNNTLNLEGVKSIFCGITPIVAQTMSKSEINLENATISHDLKSALKDVYQLQGLKLVKE